MSKLCWRLLIGVCLAAYACRGSGQQSAVSSNTTESNTAADRSQLDAKSGPSLEETLTFLSHSMKLEAGSFEGNTFPGRSCEVTTTQFQNIEVGVQEVPKLRTEKDGSSKLQYGWTMYKFDAMPGGFSLRDIDPASIESHGYLSYGFIDHPESFYNYRDPRKADSTLVLFKTRDGKQEIKSAVLPVTLKGGEEISFDQPVSSGRFIFHQQERAERFVTAFKHAVVLCGGKTSDFVRTPQD